MLSNTVVIAIMALCVITIHAAPTPPSKPPLRPRGLGDDSNQSGGLAMQSVVIPFGLQPSVESIMESPTSASVSRDLHPSDMIHDQHGLSETFASFHDNQVASRIGASAYYYMVVCASSALCYGVAISLFYASLQMSRERREGTPKAKKCLVALTCFMFILNTGLFATNIGYCFALFCWARDAVVENTPTLGSRLLSAYNHAIPYHICEGILEILNFVIGDGIIVWRAIVLWPGRRFIQGSLWCLFLGDIGVSLFVMCKSNAAIAHSENVVVWITTDSARILVSLGVNFFATLCIGIKAWQFRSTLRHGFSTAATKRSLVNRVLTLLVECGLVFCAFQLFYAIYNLLVMPKSSSNSPTSPLNLSLAAMGPFSSLFAGIYPSIVIVVMAKQESVFGTDTFVGHSYSTQQADQEQAGVLSTLRFASVPESTRDHSWTQSVVGSIEPKDSDAISVSSASTSDSHSLKAS